MNGNKIGYKEQNYGDSQGPAGNHNWSEEEPEKIPKHLSFFWIRNFHLPLSFFEEFQLNFRLAHSFFPLIFRSMSASKVGS